MADFLQEYISDYELELPETAAPAFRCYYEFLEEKNKVMNLTAISGEKEVYTLHFLDCLGLLKYFDFENKSVIDIGSGAGFPGLPVKIAKPTVKLTLLDAQQKRINFLTELCENMGVNDVACIHARAEEAAFEKSMRGSFDFAVSRAVARLNVLCELCMPFVKTGGYFLAMKSVESDEEIEEAAKAIKVLGGKLEEKIDYTVPGTDVVHRIAVIKKTADTPSGYPRRFAKISKAPLK